MTKVLAGIATSVDGYVAGPDDGPGKGLGEGGERLHYWVFGGPWTYDGETRGEPAGELGHQRSFLPPDESRALGQSSPSTTRRRFR